MSRSQLKVKGRRRGDVSVLWRLFVFSLSFVFQVTESGSGNYTVEINVRGNSVPFKHTIQLQVRKKIKGNVWILDFNFVTSKTSDRKLKSIRIPIPNNNVIRLQCTLLLQCKKKLEFTNLKLLILFGGYFRSANRKSRW